MSYPTRLKLFKAWAKAMEQGAQVGNPDYSRRRSPAAAKLPRRKKAMSRRLRRRRRSKGE